MAKKRLIAQSIIEYVSLVLIVSAAFGAMFTYIKRGIDVRLRHLNCELNESYRGFGRI